MHHLGRLLTAATALLLIAAGCGSTSPSTTDHAATTRSAAAGSTLWLCRPGLAGNPCVMPLGATVVLADGSTSVRSVTSAGDPAADCFYVYPTVSTEAGDNADLQIQPAEREAAISQASRFSTVCRVFAPMYRQRTERSLAKGLGADAHADDIAYQSLLSGWRDYLAHDNDGRPIVFIGHSQGAAMLIRLLQQQVDANPTLASRVVSAILLGGNVTVADGRTTGGTFEHLPACTAPAQVGCVIAYSSYPDAPPADSLFGRPGQGVSLQSGQTATSGVHVLCVDPAAIGGSGTLDPLFLASQRRGSVTTPWVEYPGRYTASCTEAGGADWLQVTPTPGSGDHRPTVRELQGPRWGYHLDDVNLALGNLVADVSAQITAFGAQHRTSGS